MPLPVSEGDVTLTYQHDNFSPIHSQRGQVYPLKDENLLFSLDSSQVFKTSMLLDSSQQSTDEVQRKANVLFKRIDEMPSAHYIRH